MFLVPRVTQVSPGDWHLAGLAIFGSILANALKIYYTETQNHKHFQWLATDRKIENPVWEDSFKDR